MLTIYTLGTREGEGLYCDAEGLTYGGMPLVTKSDRGMFEPCTLNGFFKSALTDRQGGIRAVANALNKNDLPLALICAAHLRLPLYDAETVAKLAKYDPNEPRDSQGRWTTGGNANAQAANRHPMAGTMNVSDTAGDATNVIRVRAVWI